MTNEDWDKAHDEASEIFRIAEMGNKNSTGGGHNSTEYFNLVREYYTTILTNDLNKLKYEKEILFINLNNSVNARLAADAVSNTPPTPAELASLEV